MYLKRKEKRVFPMEMVKQQYKKKIIVFGGDSNFLTKVEGDTIQIGLFEMEGDFVVL